MTKQNKEPKIKNKIKEEELWCLFGTIAEFVYPRIKAFIKARKSGKFLGGGPPDKSVPPF